MHNSYKMVVGGEKRQFFRNGTEGKKIRMGVLSGQTVAGH
jgi:hypothetical protein